MSLLLDTHIFLWFISDPSRLPGHMLAAIEDLGNRVYLSAASVWEAIIKYQLGKLPLPQPPESYLPLQRARHVIETLPVDEATATLLATLPPLHRDPFDRILICQALRFDLVLATVDDAIRAYPVKLL